VVPEKRFVGSNLIPLGSPSLPLRYRKEWELVGLTLSEILVGQSVADASNVSRFVEVSCSAAFSCAAGSPQLIVQSSMILPQN
jgi:hypothetical protein